MFETRAVGDRSFVSRSTCSLGQLEIGVKLFFRCFASPRRISEPNRWSAMLPLRVVFVGYLGLAGKLLQLRHWLKAFESCMRCRTCSMKLLKRHSHIINNRASIILTKQERVHVGNWTTSECALRSSWMRGQVRLEEVTDCHRNTYPCRTSPRQRIFQGLDGGIMPIERLAAKNI